MPTAPTDVISHVAYSRWYNRRQKLGGHFLHELAVSIEVIPYRRFEELLNVGKSRKLLSAETSSFCLSSDTVRLFGPRGLEQRFGEIPASQNDLLTSYLTYNT